MWKGEEGGRGLYLYTHTHTHTHNNNGKSSGPPVCVCVGWWESDKKRAQLHSLVYCTIIISLSRLFIGNIYRATEAAPHCTALHCTALLYITGRSVMQFSGTRLCVCFLIADRQTRTAAAAAHTKRRRRRKKKPPPPPFSAAPPLPFVRSFDFCYLSGFSLFQSRSNCLLPGVMMSEKNNCTVSF